MRLGELDACYSNGACQRKIRNVVMRLRHVLLSAVMSALWILGLWDQMHSREAVMRYLAISLGLVAVGVWRWQPQRKLKPRERDQHRPPQE